MSTAAAANLHWRNPAPEPRPQPLQHHHRLRVTDGQRTGPQNYLLPQLPLSSPVERLFSPAHVLRQEIQQ